MKTSRFVLIAAALLAVSAFAAPASASSVMMCAQKPTSGGNGPARVVNPNTSAAYVLNNIGCALIDQADQGYFASQGYTVIAPVRSVVAKGQTDRFSMTLPAGAYIQDIIAQETSGAAVTGGLKVGTTSGGTDISSNIVLGASSFAVALDVSIAKRAFSATAPQTIFVGPVTSFNSAAVNVTIIYGYF